MKEMKNFTGAAAVSKSIFLPHGFIAGKARLTGGKGRTLSHLKIRGDDNEWMRLHCACWFHFSRLTADG